MSAYDKSKVERRKKKFAVEIESHLFNSTEHISILDFILTFKRAWKNLSIHEGATMFLFPHFMHVNSKQDLLHRIKEGSNDVT